MKPTIAIKSNPKLWERSKQEILKSPKGGPSGKWSARKAQLAVKLYKSRGGSYRGKKSKQNSLTKWSKEKWDYISPRGRKTKSGRYLPQVVRKSLSPSQKRVENRKKGIKRGQWISYGSKVRMLMHKHGIIKSTKKSPIKCWKGFKRVSGKKPGEKGSCVKI